MSQERATPIDIKAHDGRVLRFEITGAPAGSPVFLLHGTPGSRIGPKPRASVLYRLGVQLICYDRPGYGGSDRHEDRTVADAAADIRAIADHLDIEEFSIVGRSGGGPHALAAAALLPERVIRTAVLVSLAPSDANDLDWYRGMNDANVDAYSTASADSRKLTERLRLQADRARRDPASLVEVLRTQMTDPDLRVVDDMAIRRLLTETYAEALRAGPYGWIDDVFALRSDWEFDLGAIKSPVRLWHGADDNFSPASHARWLFDRIPNAEIMVQADTAHFGAVEVLPTTLAWLIAWQADLVSARHAGTP